MKILGKYKYWLLLGFGVLILTVSIIIGVIWQSMPENKVIGMTTVILFIGGGLLVWRQLKHWRDDRGGIEVKIGDVSITTNEEKALASDNGSHTPNSVNIYANKDEDGNVMPLRIAFEYVEDPLGQPQRCLNTGKYYYIHIWDIVGEKLLPFMLPDRKFVDPAKLARYLGLPAQKKFLRHRESLMKLVGPGLLTVGVVAGFIVIIAMSG